MLETCWKQLTQAAFGLPFGFGCRDDGLKGSGSSTAPDQFFHFLQPSLDLSRRSLPDIRAISSAWITRWPGCRAVALHFVLASERQDQGEAVQVPCRLLYIFCKEVWHGTHCPRCLDSSLRWMLMQLDDLDVNHAECAWFSACCLTSYSRQCSLGKLQEIQYRNFDCL